MKTCATILAVCISFSLIANSFAQSSSFELGNTYKICTGDINKNECLSSFEPGEKRMSLGKVITDVYKNDSGQQWKAEKGLGSEILTTMFTPKKNDYNNLTYYLPKGSSYPTFNSWWVIPTQGPLYLIHLLPASSRETQFGKNALECLQYMGLRKIVEAVPCKRGKKDQRWRFERVQD